MRVFVTGASGHIASAVIPELVQAGHEVTGLARSETSCPAWTSWGMTAEAMWPLAPVTNTRMGSSPVK